MNLLIIFAAKYLFIASIILSGWFFFTLNNTFKRKFVVLTLISFALSFAIAKLLGTVINSPRPFVISHISPLIAHIADNGFPSDHTLLTMAIASVIFVYNRKLGIVLGIISLMVGFSRVLAGVHHPIDIIGAMGTAIIGTVIAEIMVRKLPSGVYVIKR